VNVHPNHRSFIVFRTPDGQCEWDSCPFGTELSCVKFHKGVLVSIEKTQEKAEREVRILNGWI
jgi:hypothetical protein